MNGLDRYLGPMRRRISLMIGRGTVGTVDDDAQAQALQLGLLADETHDGVERFQNYGVTSVPHAGAEAAVMFVGGTRSHGIVVAVEDRRYRLKGLQGGEVALYDDLGQVVHLKRDRMTLSSPTKIEALAPEIDMIATNKIALTAPEIDITATTKVSISAPEVDVAGSGTVAIDGGAIALGGAGGLPVAREGDAVSTSAITGGATKVTAV